MPSDKVLAIRSLEALAKVANGKATKIIIPSELQNLGGRFLFALGGGNGGLLFTVCLQDDGALLALSLSAFQMAEENGRSGRDEETQRGESKDPLRFP